jgi:hypothetical protein
VQHRVLTIFMYPTELTVYMFIGLCGNGLIELGAVPKCIFVRCSVTYVWGTQITNICELSLSSRGKNGNRMRAPYCGPKYFGATAKF